jgi:glycosyltransferase involved in cell wall biosynthesis
MSVTPLLVFADDWGRHPSSCQHLVRHLLPEHPTTWVNTIGTRTPQFDVATVRRAGGKLRQWFAPSSNAIKGAVPQGLTVLNPRMWPWLTGRLDRRLNRALLLRQLVPAIRALPEPPVALTTVPVSADVMGRLPVAKWVYYCVDDFGEWPGLDGPTMSRLEQLVVARAQVLIAASEALRVRLRAMGRESHLLTHGVDVDFWKDIGEKATRLDQLERPLIVFWGVIDRRMDMAFVEALALGLTRGTIVLVGPSQGRNKALTRLPRVHRTGAVPFASLPAIAREAAVLIMPYVAEPVTLAMQPLKLKEYLATNKPAVVRDLPANRDWADALDLVQTPEEFVSSVRLRIETGLPDEQARARERLRDESWANKARQFERMIFGP